MSMFEMDRDAFWTLIGQAREQLDDPGKWLMEQLMALGPEQARKFDDIANAYISLANQYGLQLTASVMDRDGYSGVCFLKFQEWLVDQGKAVYLSTLKGPDSLADAPNYRDNGQYHYLHKMGAKAYQTLTGRTAAQDRDPAGYRVLKMELARDIVYGGGINRFRTRADALSYLPRVCARYLAPVDIEVLARSRERAEDRAAPQHQTAQEGEGGGYTLKLYTPLHVEVTESGPGYQQSIQLPDPEDWMAWTDPSRIKAYHRAVLDTITADPPAKDMTAVFQSDLQGLPAFRELAGKIDSIVQTVEDVDGKFFGVTACRIKGGLDAIEAAMLKEYCRALNDEGLEIKEFYCPPSKYHDHLEVEIWCDKDQFIFTRQEMKRTLLRKPKQRAAQKGQKGKGREQR